MQLTQLLAGPAPKSKSDDDDESCSSQNTQEIREDQWWLCLFTIRLLGAWQQKQTSGMVCTASYSHHVVLCFPQAHRSA
jgi:hypothetical protein